MEHVERAGMAEIFKVLTQDDWARFCRDGLFEGSDVDRKDGYIHLSTKEQLTSTLNKHYCGMSDLHVLTIDSDALDQAKLLWEPARGGDLFPHLYGALPLAAVIGSYMISPQGDGVFVLP